MNLNQTDTVTDRIKTSFLEQAQLEVSCSAHMGEFRQGLRVWFHQLPRAQSPQISLEPTGLKRHEIKFFLGSHSRAIAEQMMQASEEQKTLAYALVNTIANYKKSHDIDLNSKSWDLAAPGFSLTFERRGVEQYQDPESQLESIQLIGIPLMAAMAELIGYEDAVKNDESIHEGEMEGHFRKAEILRRERSARNRLMCLKFHGTKCKICEVEISDIYKLGRPIIEVHHLQPISSSDNGVIYDPKNDLIPVCPNCHAALHAKKPIPFTPQELKERMIK